nr:fibronectin type III domain-containing protein [uncultured Eubacterium sp.]
MLLKKKLAVLGLAAVMTVAFIPAMAFADTTGSTTPTSSSQATTGTEIPATGQLESKTYTLTEDIPQSLTVTKGVNATLDLNGHKLTNTDKQPTITVANGGTLTITDSSSSTKGTIDNVSNTTAAIFNSGTVTIKGGVNITRSKEDGNIPNGGTNTYYNIVNHGNMTIDDASVNQNGGYSSLIENGYYDYSKDHTTGNNAEAPQLTIKGGTFSGGLNTIKNDEGGDLTIDNGTFTNTTQYVVMNWNTATINGGTFTGNAYPVVFNGSYNNHASGKLTVNGGKYSGSNFLGVYSNPGTVSVTDGDFTGIKDMVNGKTNNTKFISGGTFKSLPTANLTDKAATATVTNGTSTTYVVGEKDIQKAAEDSSNTVTITKGIVSLTGANAKIVNDNGTVTVDGTTVKAGDSVQPNAAQTIANLKNQIADLQNQIQAAASQGSTASANITNLRSDLAKAQAELKEAQAQVSEGKALLTAPGQVMNLKAKAGKRSAKLTWKAQTENTTGYRIYRKVKGGKYARVKTITKATQGSWTNKGLKKGKTYYFKVRAYKSITSGELWGAYSNTAKAKVK